MSTLDENMASMRDTLTAALHDQFGGKLEVHEIVAAVDVALARTDVRTLVDTAITATEAVTALSAEVGTPTGPTATLVANFNLNRSEARDTYTSIP